MVDRRFDVCAPLDEGLALLAVDRSNGHVEVAATLPNADAASFSADGTRLALARGLELEVRRLDCGPDPACSAAPDAVEYTLRAHNNGVRQIAIDRFFTQAATTGGLRSTI